MTDDPRVEAAARALCKLWFECGDPDDYGDTSIDREWRKWTDEAEAALAAADAARPGVDAPSVSHFDWSKVALPADVAGLVAHLLSLGDPRRDAPQHPLPAACRAAAAALTSLADQVAWISSDCDAIRDNYHRAIARAETAERLVADCAMYLKDGETPRQRMDRDHADVLALMKALADAKDRAETAEREQYEALALAEGPSTLKELAAGFIEGSVWQLRAETAERKLAVATEALKPFANVPTHGAFGGPLVCLNAVYEDGSNDITNLPTLGHRAVTRARAAYAEITGEARDE